MEALPSGDGLPGLGKQMWTWTGALCTGGCPRGRVPGRQGAVMAGALAAPLPSSVGGWTLTLTVPPKERCRDIEAEGPNA